MEPSVAKLAQPAFEPLGCSGPAHWRAQTERNLKHFDARNNLINPKRFAKSRNQGASAACIPQRTAIALIKLQYFNRGDALESNR